MKKALIISGILLCVGEVFPQTSPLFAQMLRAGNSAYQSGQYLEAELEYRKALDLQPDRPDALFNLAACLFQQGRYDQAVQALEQSLATENDPEQIARIQYNLGTSLMAKEDYPAATEAFRSALRLQPDLEAARHNLGVAIQAQQEQQPPEVSQEDQSSENQEEQQEQESEDLSEESPQNTPPSDQPPARPMTPEEAEQMLRRLEFQEQQVQEQIRQRQQRSRIRNEKDW